MSAPAPALGPVLGDLQRADHKGTAIAYQVLGESGPWLVLVHGLGYGRFGWGPMAALLAGRRRVVLIDNRGIGDSDRPPGPYTVDDMAGDVVAVMDHLGLQRPDVVGASLGGMVALQVAASYPDRTGRLVLIAATAGEPQGTALPQATAALLRGEIPRRAGTPRRLIEGALAPTTVARHPELVDALMELRGRQAQHPEGWRSQAAASAGFSLRAALGVLKCPTLAIAGTDDAVIDPENTMKLVFGLPEARAFYVAPAGHLCFWEEPELLAEEISLFLEGARSEVPAR